MSFRITNSMMFNRLMSTLRDSTSDLGKLQEQMVSMRRINRPSDDPSGASRVQTLRTEEGDYRLYTENLDQAQGLLDYTASILESVSGELVTVRGKVLAAISPTADANSRNAAAIEVNDVLKSIVSEGNSTYAGMYIFGGTQTADAPFEVTAEPAAGVDGVAYRGNSDRMRYAVGPDALVEVNEDPAEVFAPQGEAAGLFQTLIDVRRLLQNPDGLPENVLSAQLSDKLGDLDRVHDDVVRGLGRVGTRSKTLQIRRDLYSLARIGSAQRRSELEDADIADVALRLQNQQMILQVVLAGSKTVYSSNLMDFLR